MTNQSKATKITATHMYRPVNSQPKVKQAMAAMATMCKRLMVTREHKIEFDFAFWDVAGAEDGSATLWPG